MKKKIVFVLYSLPVGGVEKSFLNLMSAFPIADYDITLMLMTKRGEYLDMLPDSIRVIESTCYPGDKFIINQPPLTVVKRLIRSGRLMALTRYLVATVKRRFFGDDLAVFKMVFRDERALKGEAFDVAIAYAGPSLSIDYFTRYKIHANKYLGWIHFDANKIGIPVGGTNEIYDIYSKIFVVAEQGLSNFGAKFPQLKPKLEVFHNVVNPVSVRRDATKGETFNDAFDGVRLLCVGRISYEKGQSLAIEALNVICRRGVNARLYLVGHGSDMERCKAMAREMNLEDKVIFLGLKVNPYPYMRDCDVYIQPSRHEGYCISLAEARCFDVPIVSTDFTGAAEQLAGRAATRIVSFDAEAMANAVIEVLEVAKTTRPEPISACESDVHKLLELL